MARRQASIGSPLPNVKEAGDEELLSAIGARTMK